MSGKWPRNAPIIVMHRIPTNRLTAKEIPVIPKEIMMTRGKMPTRLGSGLSVPWRGGGAGGFAAFAIGLVCDDPTCDDLIYVNLLAILPAPSGYSISDP